MGACLSYKPTSGRTTKLEPAQDIADKSTSVFIDRSVPEHVTAKQCELSSTNFDSFGSEEDVFFDAQPWLVPDDTDNEFFGMDGDFTPSRTPYSSSTPTRRSLSTTPKHSLEDIISVGYNLTPTSERRRSLSELFLESDDDQEGYTEEFKPQRSSSSSPYFLEPSFLKQSNDTSVNGSSVTNRLLWQL